MTPGSECPPCMACTLCDREDVSMAAESRATTPCSGPSSALWATRRGRVSAGPADGSLPEPSGCHQMGRYETPAPARREGGFRHGSWVRCPPMSREESSLDRQPRPTHQGHPGLLSLCGRRPGHLRSRVPWERTRRWPVSKPRTWTTQIRRAGRPTDRSDGPAHHLLQRGGQVA
jgi:hypothetical protein